MESAKQRWVNPQTRAEGMSEVGRASPVLKLSSQSNSHVVGLVLVPWSLVQA